jgi:hypothetical protein
VIKLFGAKFKCAKLLGLNLVSFECFISLYSKLICWVMEGRKYATAGGDQAYFCRSSLVEVYELLTCVLISFHCTI